MIPRTPIGKRIRRLVVNVTSAALLLTITISAATMYRIREKNKEVLLTQMDTRLYNRLRDKAKFADAELKKYLAYAYTLSDYITFMYCNPSKFMPNEISVPDAKNKGRFAMQRTLAGEQVSYDSVREECCLLGNVEHVWTSFMKQHSEIGVLYLGTKSGLMLAYDVNSDLSAPKEGNTEDYYDYTASSWYQIAAKTQTTGFTDVYYDYYGRGQTISVFAPFYDAEGEFAGALGMDINIESLYRDIVAIDMGRGAYAFVVDKSGKLISSSYTPKAEATMLKDDADITPAILHEILLERTGLKLSDSDIYYAYTPIRSAGWMLCIKMPKRFILSMLTYIYESLDWAIILLLMLFVVILLVVQSVGQMFAEWLVAPIRRLDSDVETISGGNLNHQAKVSSNDEIGDLAMHFNEMTASLQAYIADLANVTTEKERIGAELSIAAQIQADMLPKIIPPYMNHEAFDIAATMTPAKEVAGDFYDFFMIDDDHLALVMADVSGKGVPAALFMVIAKTLIKNRAMMGGTPGSILYDVNNQLCEGNDSSLFVTVWLGILELSTGYVSASNAGHEFPAVREPGGTYKLFETEPNPALAVMPGMEFTEGGFQLEHLDMLYLYTDGVTEATNINRELYGTDRMLDELNKTAGAPANGVLDIMNRSVKEFAGKAPQFDDVTMLCLQYFDRNSELTIEASTTRLHEVIAFVDGYLEKWGCPVSCIAPIELAVEEIFVNIANYAYNGQECEGTAKISIRHLGKDVEIIFTDSGTPYNPLEHDDPDITLDADERDIGGLGIYIVKQSMSSVTYEYIDKNNVLKMRKNIEDEEEE